MLETGGSLSDVAKDNSGNKTIDSLFSAMLTAYQLGDFAKALEIKQQTDKNYAGNQLQTKFDYLQAICFIKSDNTNKGIELLQQLVIDYPGTDIAVKSQEIIEANERLKAQAKAALNPTSTAVKVFQVANSTETIDCIFTFPKGANTNMIRAALSDFAKKQFAFENVLVNTSTAIGSNNVIRISQFSKAEIAKEFVNFLSKSNSYFAEKGLYEYQAMWISESNYLLLTQLLDLNGYRIFYENQ